MTAKICKTVLTDPAIRLADGGTAVFEPRGAMGSERCVVNVYPDLPQQTVIGIGGAATESAAWCWAHLNDEAKEQFIRDYFDPAEGIGYNFLRIHIGGADFSLSPYHHIEPGDWELKTFSLERDRRYVIPFLKAVQEKYPFKLIASPWSPPPFMKDNDSFVGGSLRPDAYDAWARYLGRFVEEYRGEGLNVDCVTLQNESWHVKNWETCGYTHEQAHDFAVAAAKVLHPLGVKIYFWDHNRQDLIRAARVMYRDEAGLEAADGAAYHLYSGDHFENVRLFRELWPGKDVLFTEGCAYDEERSIKKKNAVPFAQKYARELAMNLNAGATGFLDWNLVLDEACGPSNLREVRKFQCDAPVRSLKDGSYLKTPSYYAIGQYARFIRPGARILASTSYSPDLLPTAFRDPEGSVGCVLYNQSAESTGVQLVVGEERIKFEMEPLSVYTLIFEA